MEVRVGGGLEAEKLAAEGAHVDLEGPRRGRAEGQGLGEESVVFWDNLFLFERRRGGAGRGGEPARLLVGSGGVVVSPRAAAGAGEGEGSCWPHGG